MAKLKTEADPYAVKTAKAEAIEFAEALAAGLAVEYQDPTFLKTCTRWKFQGFRLVKETWQERRV
jgi:hypothetical protein